jgi:DnaJ family protein C protein 17
MANNDLLKWVTSDVDFYELLGITFENCSESELRRAYRKTALKYHPDKAGKDYDAAKYELFQSANEVLSDPELKAKYDNHRNARIQKQRANELFEGKRRQMKEDLEARERGTFSAAGVKRPREDDPQSEIQQELRRLAEEGRKRRAARASMMGESVKAENISSPAPSSPRKKSPPPAAAPAAEEAPEEDEVERLERRIREAEAAKAKRKAEKKARRSGIFVPSDSPVIGEVGADSKWADKDTATPIKRPDIFKGLKADEKSSASPKFSFSPNTPQKNDFSATMARLRAAEKQRLEEEIRQQDTEAAT